MTSQIEIMQLRNQIKDLEAKLDEMTSHRCIAYKCKKAPYASIRYNGKTKEFYFSWMRAEAWKAFREMSKELFLIDREVTIRRDGFALPITEKPRKLKDMTPEQQAIAAEFLDEVVEIFNKYFMEINREIIVDGKPVVVRAVE